GSSASESIDVIADENDGTIEVTATNSCGSSGSTALQVSVDAAPSVSLIPFDIYCTSESAFALSGGSPAGGDYFIDGIPSTNFDPGSGAGIYTITYTYSDANGC